MPASPIVPRLTVLSGRLNALHTRFGDPRYVHPVPLGTDYANLVLELGTQQIPVVPNPKIIPLSSLKRTGGLPQAGNYLGSAVEITGDEWVCSGIPRTYSEEDLSNARVLLWCTKIGNTPWTGQRGEVTFVDRSRMMDLSILIQLFRHR